MATIKITELSARTLTSDTANTIFVGVDLETGITGKYTAKNMADNLYANNSLNVGNNFTLLSKPITFADGTTQNTSFVVTGTYANAAFLNANSAYNSQNTTGSYANSAYTQANTANTNAATADSKAVSTGSYANSAFSAANSADSKAVTAGSYANSAFSAANTADSKAVTAGSYANSAFSAANTADSKAVTAGSYANSAFDVANSAALYANGSFIQANAAYTRANNSLDANTGGTVTGNVTVTAFTNLGNVSNVIITGGSANNILTTDGVGGNLSWTSKTTFPGQAFVETFTILTSPGSSITIDTLNQSSTYYTSNTSSNITINFRGNSTTTLDNTIQTGQITTAVVLITNGATGFYINAFQIDGVSVTPKWLTGIAPSSGNANSIDVYNITIIKTAASTYTVLAGISKFS
jgi:hypothetical protein